MRNYTLNCIFPPELTGDEIIEKRGAISLFIQDEGGSIIRTSDMGTVDLGYKINNREKGYFELFNFSIDPEKLPSIEFKLKDMKDLLRFMIEHKKPTKGRDVAKMASVSKKEEGSKAQKANLKEIDKKIEEILKS